jgi:hypothetical protein
MNTDLTETNSQPPPVYSALPRKVVQLWIHLPGYDGPQAHTVRGRDRIGD